MGNPAPTRIEGNELLSKPRLGFARILMIGRKHSADWCIQAARKN
jgi:hypothetical protein